MSNHKFKFTKGPEQNPYNLDTYLGNINVKRHKVKQNLTPWEVGEFIKCKNSIEYFIENYIKIIHPDHGLVDFTPFVYQKRMFKHFDDNRFSITLACRQSGKSISSCAYLLHFGIFNSNKLIAILANKGSTSKEMLSRITLMLENLPFFLQPGCKALNRGSIEFSNGTRIEAHSTSSSSIRGKSVSLLYLDEFAFVDNDQEFYTSTYPVISSGKSTKVIITSTANGIGNTFYKLWEGSVTGTNQFAPFRVDWWDVPGRDEAWKAQTIANTSAEQFEQEFGNSFASSSTTLISTDALLSLKAEDPIQHSDNVKIYEKPIKRRGNNLPPHDYILLVDVAKGRGQDYSTISVIDISQMPYKQVATYRDSLVSPLTFPDIIRRLAVAYNDAYVIIESNDQGSLVFKILKYDLEYENLFMGSVRGGKSMGLEMNKKIKKIGCSNLKDLIEMRKLSISDADTIKELCVFESKGDSYAARDGNHDDMVMGLVSFAWFVNTNMFGNFSDENLRQMMSGENQKLIEASVPFFGFIDDGTQGELIYGVWEEENEGGSVSGFIKDDVFGYVLEESEDQSMNILF